MSNRLLNVVAHQLRFYYAVAEAIKDSRDVVFIVLAGKHKTMGSWSKAAVLNLFRLADNLTNFVSVSGPPKNVYIFSGKFLNF